MLALYRLGKLKGYSLVYANAFGVNLFFVRDDVLCTLEASGYKFKNINDVKALYKPPKYGKGPNGGHAQDPYYRPYLSSEKILSQRKYPT